MPRRWSAHQDLTLSAMYRAGVAVRDIASRLERSEDAVDARRRQLNLTARRATAGWSAREDLLLEAAARAGLSASLAAEQLRRPLSQVRWRRRVLGLTRASSRPYAPQEDAALRAVFAQRGDLHELAMRLGRSPDALRLRARKLGLHRPAPRRRWTPDEDAAIRDGYDNGLTCAEITAELAGRTVAAVAARARQLGLATHARRWTASDDERLRRLVHDKPLHELARLLGRTPEALRQRARKLGVRLRDESPCPRAGQPWTTAEDEMLRLHPGLNPAALAQLLGRSDRAVTIRLAKLGLRDGRYRSPHRRTTSPGRVTAGERALLQRELRVGDQRRLRRVARRLGLPAAALANAADGSAPSSYDDGS